MTDQAPSRRTSLRALTAATLVAMSTLAVAGKAAAQTVQMISHRYPALEHYAEKMRAAVPGVEVNTQLMPFDKANELATIALSAKADTLDIVYTSDATILKYAKNGWLRPLDDLFEKYKDEYKLGDIDPAVLDTYRWEGKLYVIPHNVNVMMLFYRKDLLDEAGKQPPKTFEEYLAMAQEFNSPLRAGVASCLKPVDAGLNETHWYMNAIGDGWLDGDMRPIFNNENGVKAVEMLKQITAFAQPGFTAAANDECALAYQQELATMGLQWATRAASMDNPQQSRVIGKIEWAVAPGGHARRSGDGYAISAFSRQDPDLLFRIIMASASEESMREAAALAIPSRMSLLADPELSQKYRHYSAVRETIPTAVSFPALPEFYELGEFISRRVLQAVTGEMEVKAALDEAAREAEALLKSRGYY